MSLVNLRPLLPDAIFDLRYATADNVFGKALYEPDFEPQLEAAAARQLVYATKLFMACSVVPVIWDVYRPREVQIEMLRYNDDPRYVLGPDDSNHPKGLAVDLTLARLQTPANPQPLSDRLLDMGTGFDDFSESAHLDGNVSRIVRNHRRFLDNIMTMADFRQRSTEWWHFDLIGAGSDTSPRP